MLPDPLILRGLNFSAATAAPFYGATSVAVTDVSPGRSVRRGIYTVTGTPLELTISHSVSNENKPVKTDRHLVRLDVTLSSDAQNPSKGDLTASAYLVVTVPRGAVDVNADGYDPYLLVSSLLGLLTINSSTNNFDQRDKFNRIMAGEP